MVVTANPSTSPVSRLSAVVGVADVDVGAITAVVVGAATVVGGADVRVVAGEQAASTANSARRSLTPPSYRPAAAPSQPATVRL
jgi:hypothetical protein